MTFANSKGPGKETRRYGQYIEADLGADSLEPGDVVTINASGEAVAADGLNGDPVGYVYAITNDLVTIKAQGSGVARATAAHDPGTIVGKADDTTEAGAFDAAGDGWVVLDSTTDHPLSDVDGGPWVEVLKL